EREPTPVLIYTEAATRPVSHGAVDFAIAAMPSPPSGLCAERIAVDRFFCVYPPGHRFERSSRLTWADFDGEPFVAFDEASSIRAYVDRALQTAGVGLGSITEARDIGAVAGLTAAGLGVSIVPGLVVPMVRFAGVRAKVLHAPVLERGICLFYDPARPLTQAASDLMDALRQAAGHGFSLPKGARWAMRDNRGS
ncbi:MAG: LysR family transcriptional regulator, partial [Actinobacteria bacterium]|nr:LysR family transcriptional regulator [Actinomycetota bacterium]